MNNDYDIEFHEPEEAKPVSKKKIIIIISVVIGVVLLITLTAGLIWYNSPKQKFRRAIDRSDFVKAIDIQQNKDLTVDDRTIGVLNDNLIEIKNDYTEGRIDFEDALTKVNLIKKIGGSDVNEKVVKVEKLIKDLDSSSKSYKQAERAFNAKEYANAILLFDEVLEIDTNNYTNAQRYKQDAIEQYRNEQFSVAKAKADSNDYVNAIALLKNSLEVLPEDKLINARIKEYRSIAKEQDIQEILYSASKSVDSGDLISAINYITLSISKYDNDERLTKRLDEYTSKYVNNVMSQVGEYKKNKDYNGAISVLTQANTDLPSNTDISNKLLDVQKAKEEAELKEKKLQILKEAEETLNSQGYEAAIKVLQSVPELSSDSDIKAKIAEYQEYKPISLFELEYLNSSSNVKVRGPLPSKDNMGETHQQCYKLEDPSNNNRFVAYKINGKYNHLRGKFFLAYYDRSRSYDYTFNVYDDYNTLLYTTTIKSGVEPVTFDVNISGVDNLIIEVISYDNSWAGDDSGCSFEGVTVSK